MAWDGRPVRMPMRTYSPAWTASTTNPTGYSTGSTGTYAVDTNGMCDLWLRVRANASGFSAGSGLYSVSLPVTAASRGVQILRGEAYDSSAGSVIDIWGRVQPGGTTVSLLCPPTSAGAYVRAVQHNIPFGFAASDWIILQGRLEVA